MEYRQPSSVTEAVAALAAGEAVVLSGGTDVFPALRDRPLGRPALDISRIEGLRTIAESPAGWRFGALTTWTDMLKATLPPVFDGLKAAGREVGSPQIQNAGTLAGNLCNASPAADGIPPLLALDASVELTARSGARTLPLAAFLTGVRRTALRSDELVTAILVPRSSALARSGFAKLGSRSHLVISIAMVAVTIVPDEAGGIAEARITVGACSPVAMRLAGLERDLRGISLASGDWSKAVTPDHFEMLSPIDDVRASADYRREAALQLVRRTLGTVASSIAAVREAAT